MSAVARAVEQANSVMAQLGFDSYIACECGGRWFYDGAECGGSTHAGGCIHEDAEPPPFDPRASVPL